MNKNYLLMYLVAAYFPLNAVAHEAIVGGQLVNISSQLKFEYQGLILVGPDHAPDCGGAIIQSSYVVTAAQCVISLSHELKSKNISVLAGTQHLHSPGVVIYVEKVFVLKEYNPRDSNHNGDIAVLKLRSPFIFGNEMSKSLKLSRKKIHCEEKIALIAGFGWNEMDENNVLIGSSDDALRYATADIRTHEECQNDHPALRLTQKHLCARVRQPDDDDHRPRGVCFGDDGGPLVIKRNSLIVGILSISTANCSERSSSGIYTNIGYYWRFINNVVNNVTKKVALPYKTYII